MELPFLECYDWTPHSVTPPPPPAPTCPQPPTPDPQFHLGEGDLRVDVFGKPRVLLMSMTDHRLYSDTPRPTDSLRP